MSCRVVSCHVISCHVMSCHVVYVQHALAVSKEMGLVDQTTGCELMLDKADAASAAAPDIAL